ncbi:S8 family peptidase [Myroides odoratimimus]|uniref:S8 family peptidase n=1 Tax=Myroides odoratimimus TaxID=76832 RepID=UPI002DBC1129|nr:S8 family peptidase [Myroides odoratimimus]MEC4052505.1 S8 family peptidase [Myroides odoratimimus]
MAKNLKPHLFVSNVIETRNYSKPSLNIRPIPLPIRDRKSHGDTLFRELEQIWSDYDINVIDSSDLNVPIKQGEYITFKGAVNQQLELGSLSANGAVLLNTRRLESAEDITTIYIPSDKRNNLLNKIYQYSTEPLVKGKPRNQSLVSKIETLYRSSIENIWTSRSELLPHGDPKWCEIWLTLDESSYTDEESEELLHICRLFGIKVSDSRLFFPERTVISIYANSVQLGQLFSSYSYIAEIRRAEELNQFWTDELTTSEREEYSQDLVDRITTDNANPNHVVTILDSGVNNDHILLQNFLSDKDRLTVNSNWGLQDVGYRGHATAMAGLILYPELKTMLESNEEVSINYRLESIKILPPDGVTSEEHWHYITLDAVNTAILSNVDYNRIYCMAVTGENQNDFGRPSTWSATIDRIVCGVDDEQYKLFVISAGNVRLDQDLIAYPESNLNLSIESPAQAWNAITVGAYTDIVLEGVSTLAKKGELSPYTRTSCSWENWTVKPEVVFEGGNAEITDSGIARRDELELLTTSHIQGMNKFITFNATSAATALASSFLARLRDVYPDAKEETLRGLMIHSADWTDQMKEQFSVNEQKGSKQELLKIVGYGVPNFDKAIACKESYLTLISETTITPYKKEGGDIKTNEVHYYDLPWPVDILESLGSTKVKLKVTLSYFIEPNPGEKGYSTKYAYQSSALEFKLISPTETFKNFKIRVNRLEQEANDFNRYNDGRWYYGSNFKGSIHSNFIEGNAADIARCNKLAVFPKASGWWKNLKKKKRYDDSMRYSLIISIETPEVDVDIYTPVAVEVVNKNMVDNIAIGNKIIV